jgi:hypothetical protein
MTVNAKYILHSADKYSTTVSVTRKLILLSLQKLQQQNSQNVHKKQEQDGQRTYNVTFRCVRVTIPAVEKQY